MAANKKVLSPRKSKVPSLAGTFGQSTASGLEIGQTLLAATAALRQKKSLWALQVVRLSEPGKVGQVYGKVVTGRANSTPGGSSKPISKNLDMSDPAAWGTQKAYVSFRHAWACVRLAAFITWDSELATNNIVSVGEQLKKTHTFLSGISDWHVWLMVDCWIP